MDDRKYWNKFYKENKEANLHPSTFAVFSEKWIGERKSLIEFGCGNGRDSIYFSKAGINVTSVDNSQETVGEIQRTRHEIKAVCKDVIDIFDIKESYDVVYSRFFLHSIDEQREDMLLSWASKKLNTDGILLIEARTVEDRNMEKTHKNHFRRYIDAPVLKKKLHQLGFDILYSIESQGLSVYGKEDPFLIRIVAQRNDTANRDVPL